MAPQLSNDPPSPFPDRAEVILRDLVGRSSYRGPMRTLEEMADAIRQGARERFSSLFQPKEPLC